MLTSYQVILRQIPVMKTINKTMNVAKCLCCTADTDSYCHSSANTRLLVVISILSSTLGKQALPFAASKVSNCLSVSVWSLQMLSALITEVSLI